MRRLVHALLRRYARGQAAAVRPFVVGGRVLDLGAGEGYVAAALRERPGAWICPVDVGPFRRASGGYVVYDGDRLPFGDDAFDTTLLLLTLHHCAAPEAVLDEAVRVTRRRLIVSESVYRTPRDRFWLDLLDGRFNRHRHEGRMPPALNFKRPDEWRTLFQKLGLRVTHLAWLGSRCERLVHHPLLFVLDKAPTVTGPRGGASVRPASSGSGVGPGRSSWLDDIAERGVDLRGLTEAPPRGPVTVTGVSSTKKNG